MTTPRHVAVDLTPLLPGGENGGAKVFVLELIPRLARLAPETRFTLLTQAASHAELAVLERGNVTRLQVLGESASRARGAAFRVGSALLAHGPDALRRAAARAAYALHTRLKTASGDTLQRLGADLLFCPFTAPTYRAPSVPTVCTVYDLQFHAHPEFFTPEDAELRARAFREACAHATRLAAISEFSRAQTMDYAHVDPARIRAIPLRLALRVAAGTQADIVERLDLMPGGYLLYPANFWKHKNHERLLEAFARAKEDPALNGRRLVLTGAPGERRDAVEATAVRLGLRDRVVFPGFVTDAELAALMQGARALVFPSLYEGFGLPVLEAMACGVPVACSDGTALHEVAQGAALLFAPADVDAIARALVAIAGDEGLRAQLVASGTQRAGEYSDADAMAREYWHLFREAMPA